MLDAARRRAVELAQQGALFPWRTINGEEASAYYAAGTAQYHINADIAFALCKYVNGTGDEDFMVREGVEILVETARRLVVEILDKMAWSDAVFAEEFLTGHAPKAETARALFEARLLMSTKQEEAKALYAKAMKEDPALANLYDDLKAEFTDLAATVAGAVGTAAPGLGEVVGGQHGVELEGGAPGDLAHEGAQLAHVAGPLALHEVTHERGREGGLLEVELLFALVEEVLRQRRNVLAPIAELRHADLAGRQALVEVEGEAAGLRLFF